MVAPARLALTSTPSIGPSSAEVICPLSATFWAATGEPDWKASDRAASRATIKMRIGVSPLRYREQPFRYRGGIPLRKLRGFNGLARPSESSPRQLRTVVVHVAVAGLAVLFNRVRDIAAAGLDVERRRRP